MPKDAAVKAVSTNTAKVIERGSKTHVCFSGTPKNILEFRKSFKGIVAFATAEDEKEFQEKHNNRIKKEAQMIPEEEESNSQ